MPELPFLQIELTGHKLPRTDKDEMRIQLRGDPYLICAMISQAMQADRSIAAAFIGSVVDFAEKEGFNCGQLSLMVRISKPNK